MCGIVGCLHGGGGRASRERLSAALDVIRHRGPDDSGLFVEGPLGLGHVRLSILDLSRNAAQPMQSQSGRFVIAYNGETYNFALLREELVKQGFEPRSSGDTEALLEHIERFGLDHTLQLMEGMFAFAVWDREEECLTLARDRHGIKPLYYATSKEGAFWFASEMKALLEFSEGADHTSISAAMLGLGCAHGEHTLLRGISSVRAGEKIELRRDKPVVHSFFFRQPEFVNEEEYRRLDAMGPKEALAEVSEALEESMRLCMISDTPLAVLASGGIDSSLIAAFAARSHPDLKLFHANVVGASETPAAEALARHLGCELFSERVTQQDTLDHTPAVTYHYEMPLMYHSNAVPFYLVSRLVAQNGVKVVLTGEGSDEHFIGYPRLAVWPIRERYRSALRGMQALASKVPGLGAMVGPELGVDRAVQLRSTLLRYELDVRRTEAEGRYSFIRKWSERLLSYMSLDMCEGNIPPLLHRNDRLGMAWGIESRFPFLGYALARTALNLPPKFKVRPTLRFSDRRHPFLVDKWAVRAIADRMLPASLSRRGKYAFRAVAYQHLNLTPAFFLGGFVQDHFGLSKRAVELMLEKSDPEWRSRLFMLEIWGRIFVQRVTSEAVASRVQSQIGLSDR